MTRRRPMRCPGSVPSRRGPMGGFTLIELMVTVSLLAILLAFAAPAFTAWLANSKVRGATEVLQNGIRLAQSEAVRRNRLVVFSLTNDTPGAGSQASATGKNWAVHWIGLAADEAAVNFLQGGDMSSVAPGVSVTMRGSTTAICFNFAGRLTANAAPGVSGAQCTTGSQLVSYRLSKTGADRELVALVSLAGQVRMCDPQRTFSSDQPDGCPALP